MFRGKLDLQEAYDSSPHPTHKHSSYFDVYPEVLAKYRDQPITLVEVGLFKGGSLFMWRDFLGPQARIIGVDIEPESLRWQKDGFEIYVGDQANPEFWKNFFSQVGKIDVLIDDGGHTNEQQIITVLKSLEWINDDGTLIVEDTHCSYRKDFGNPHRYSFINFAKRLADSINTRFFGTSDKLGLSEIVFSIQFFQSIVVFHVDRDKSVTSFPTKNIAAEKSEVGEILELGKGKPLKVLLQKISARFYVIPREYLKNFKMKKYFLS
jgi:hypothetical protein